MIILLDRNMSRNSPHSSIKLELIKLNTNYSFSFNPKPLLCGDDSEKYIKKTLLNLHELLRKMDYCNITLFLESSPLGRLHFHGTIAIRKVAQFALHDMPRLIEAGTFEIDNIENENIWNDYCAKQKHIWKCYIEKLFPNNPIIKYQMTNTHVHPQDAE